MAEPLVYGLFRAAKCSAWHMELRDSYTPDDPDWLDWQSGKRLTRPSGGQAGLTWFAPRSPVVSVSAVSASSPSR